MEVVNISLDGAGVGICLKGQESFPISTVYEFMTLGLLVQEYYYSATTHIPCPLFGYILMEDMSCGRSCIMRYYILKELMYFR